MESHNSTRSRNRGNQSGNNPPARGSLQLPKFSSRGDYVAFEAQFQNVARQCYLDDDTCAEMLGCALEGTAQRFYARLPVPNWYDYQWLASTMRKRYCLHVPEIQREKLLSRTRKSGESVADLGDDIWSLVQESYPEMAFSFQESIALDCLKQAVDQELQLRFIDREVKTLQEAVDVTEIYESVMKRSKPPVTSQNKSVRAVQAGGKEVKCSDNVNSRLGKVEQDVSCLKTGMDKLQKTLDGLCRSADTPCDRGQQRPNQVFGRVEPDRRHYPGRENERSYSRSGECLKCGRKDQRC